MPSSPKLTWTAFALATCVILVAVVLFALHRSSIEPGKLLSPPHGTAPSPGDPLTSTRSPIRARPDADSGHAAAVHSHNSAPISGDTHDRFTIEGTVRAREREPIAGARVRAWLESGGEALEIADATTDSQGHYAIAAPDVDALDPLRRALAHVVARAQAHGFQSHEQRRVLQDNASADRVVSSSMPAARGLTLDFRLESGNTLTGRIVDSTGKPAGFAHVAVSTAGKTTAASARVGVGEVETDRAGRFAIGFVSSGTYRLAARAKDLGTAAVETLALEAGTDRDLGDIMLHGEGALAGVVQYVDGTPAADFEVWAVPDEVASEANALTNAVHRAPQDEHGDGLYFGECTTDAAGRFEFAGLRPGRYALRSPAAGCTLEPRDVRFATGMLDIRVALDAHRLRVTVKDALGSPLPGAIVACSEMIAASDGSLETTRVRHAVALGAQAVASFEVEPDVTLGISACAPGARSTEDLAILAPNQFELVRELVLRPAGAPGSLRVSITGEGGERLRRIDVALSSALTQQRLDDLGVLSADEQGRIAKVPPGRYLVQIGCRGEGDASSMYFPIAVREALEIRAGEETQIVLAARRGARIALEIASLASNAAAAREGASVVLVPQDGKPDRRVQFRVPRKNDPHGSEIVGRLPFATRAEVEELLEPGEYVLRARAPGFEEKKAGLFWNPGASKTEGTKFNP